MVSFSPTTELTVMVVLGAMVRELKGFAVRSLTNTVHVST